MAVISSWSNLSRKDHRGDLDKLQKVDLFQPFHPLLPFLAPSARCSKRAIGRPIDIEGGRNAFKSARPRITTVYESQPGRLDLIAYA
jgi:hypothetical protein